MLKIYDNGDLQIKASTADIIAYLYVIFNVVEKNYEDINLKKLLLDYAKSNKEKQEQKRKDALKLSLASKLFNNKDKIKEVLKEILK